MNIVDFINTNNIFIVNAPRQSGKTTYLLNTLKKAKINNLFLTNSKRNIEIIKSITPKEIFTNNIFKTINTIKNSKEYFTYCNNIFIDELQDINIKDVLKNIKCSGNIYITLTLTKNKENKLRKNAMEIKDKKVILLSHKNIKTNNMNNNIIHTTKTEYDNLSFNSELINNFHIIYS